MAKRYRGGGPPPVPAPAGQPTPKARRGPRHCSPPSMCQSVSSNSGAIRPTISPCTQSDRHTLIARQRPTTSPPRTSAVSIVAKCGPRRSPPASIMPHSARTFHAVSMQRVAGKREFAGPASSGAGSAGQGGRGCPGIRGRTARRSPGAAGWTSGRHDPPGRGRRSAPAPRGRRWYNRPIPPAPHLPANPPDQ